MIDLTKVLEDLKQEREMIEQTIIALERLAAGRGPRRGAGETPGAVEATAPRRRGRPLGSRNKAKAEESPLDSAVA